VRPASPSHTVTLVHDSRPPRPLAGLGCAATSMYADPASGPGGRGGRGRAAGRSSRTAAQRRARASTERTSGAAAELPTEPTTVLLAVPGGLVVLRRERARGHVCVLSRSPRRENGTVWARLARRQVSRSGMRAAVGRAAADPAADGAPRRAASGRRWERASSCRCPMAGGGQSGGGGALALGPRGGRRAGPRDGHAAAVGRAAADRAAPADGRIMHRASLIVASLIAHYPSSLLTLLNCVSLILLTSC
jgi:hypothetical protein